MSNFHYNEKSVVVAGNPRAARVYVHEELVPLGQACAAAYHVLTEGPKWSRDVEQARGLLAIALSRVATLYRMTDGAISPLGQAEIRKSLSCGAPDLYGLYIRRGALLAAVETLKTVPAIGGSMTAPRRGR